MQNVFPHNFFQKILSADRHDGIAELRFLVGTRIEMIIHQKSNENIFLH